jgi:hypothetical protein
MPPRPAWLGRAQSWLAGRAGTDVGLALGVVFIITVLIVPLPPLLLDSGLSLSFTGSILVLMVALFIGRPLDFTSFPTTLLLMTLLRLAPSTKPRPGAGGTISNTRAASSARWMVPRNSSAATRSPR